MAVDPFLISDTCIYHEAAPGDGGNHVVAQWWLSPDVTIVGAPMGNVLGGTNNTINVIPRRKSGGCNLPQGTEINPDVSVAVAVELYVCVPGPVIKPNDATQAKSLGTQVANLQSGAASTVPFSFVTTNVPNTPDGPGHKCLIARSYPGIIAPDPNSLTHLPDDQHYAQHNICIQICGGPGAARVPGECQFAVATANPDRERPSRVTLRLEADTRPNRTVLDALLPRLRQVPAFQRLARSAPPRFDLRLPDFPDAQGHFDGGHGCLGLLFGKKSKPRYSVNIQLSPDQVTHFRVRTDLSRSSFGDAHIFHLTQAGEDGRVQGGVTVVFVVG